jgi:hypothetical protein
VVPVEVVATVDTVETAADALLLWVSGKIALVSDAEPIATAIPRAMMPAEMRFFGVSSYTSSWFTLQLLNLVELSARE